jgi:hypothetical protein
MPDLPSLLSAAAASAEPPSQPEFSSIRERASRRATRRRTALVLSVAAVVIIGSVAVAQGLGRSSAPSSGPIARPCASPFSDSGSGAQIAFPTTGGTLRITVRVGQSVFVGWSRCGERGRWTTTDRLDETGHLVGFAFSGDCCRGNPNAKAELMGYHAREVGTVTLVGRGNQGSHGKVVIRIEPGADGTRVEPVPTPHSYLKDKDRSTPKTASCPKVAGPVVTLVLGHTTFTPACAAVTPIQQLRVQNRSGSDATVTYGRYPPRIIKAGQTYTFNLKFGYELAFGVHDVPISIYRTEPELWVYVG